MSDRSWIWVAVLGMALGMILWRPSATRAQDQPPATASAESAVATEAGQGDSFLRWMIRSSGLIGAVILVMSFYLVALVVWMAAHYRKSVAVPESLIHEVGELVAQKRFSDAYQRLAADRSFLGRTLAAGVRKLPSGYPAAQRAMEMVNEDITMEMEHRTTYLATVGTLGPMIGLVGTVYGMIRSFQVMATAGGSPQAGQLAAGISTALFATLEGIAISIPAISFYSLYRNRIARLSLEVELAAEALLEQFAPGVRTPHPLAASVGPSRTAIGGPKAET